MCIDWDEQISEDIVTRWFSWLCVLTNVVSFRIPKSLSPDLINAERIKHHLFADASEDTFAVSAYLRISRSELDDVTFVATKSNFAPQKGLKIYRLELKSCVM